MYIGYDILFKGKWRDFNENLLLHTSTSIDFNEIVIGGVRVINSSPFGPCEVVSDSIFWQSMKCKTLGVLLSLEFYASHLIRVQEEVYSFIIFSMPSATCPCYSSS